MRTTRRAFVSWIAIILALCVLAPFPRLHASLPASDSFTSAGSSLGANWTEQTHGFSSDGNNANPAVVDDATYNLAFWNADSFNADHYSEVTAAASFITVRQGPTVRASGTGGSGQGYVLLARDSAAGATELDIWASGAYSSTIGATFNLTIVTGDVIRLSVTSTTFTITVNGGQTVTRTDATYASGSAGMVALGGGSNTPSFSLWGANNVGGGGGGSTTTGCLRTLLGAGCVFGH